MYANLLLLCIALVSADQLEVNDKIMGSLIHSFEESAALPETHSFDKSELLRDLRFEPPHIDFGTLAVGQAGYKTVTLVNQNSNRSVQLNSVSGPIPIFYSSFFESREVPPQGNTTFNVVFLPRQLGAISTNLRIHTSFGYADYTVRGAGRECPYRIKPLMGIKAPINATLAPEIHMYNPHERPLQILEVYSSGGEFQLELPSGGHEGPQNLWEIPPYSMKPVIRISFHGRTVGNHTAYIRIKISERTNEPMLETNENVLVIPVEFEIQSKPDIYARNPVVDFGRLGTRNSKPLRFQLDVYDDRPLKRQREHTLIAKHRDFPGLSFDAKNASVVLDPKLFTENVVIDDLLRVQSNVDDEDSQEFTVLVRAEIYKGDLYYDRNETIFITGGEPLQTKRKLIVRNDFEVPLIIYNASLDENSSVAELMTTVQANKFILQPGESTELLQIRLLNEQAVFKTTLRIDTNVSTFEVPIAACTGKLHVSTQESELRLQANVAYNSELDLGAIPYAEMSRNGFIILRNDNPIPVKITKWDFEKPQSVYFHIHFAGCLRAVNVTENETLETDSAKFYFCGQLAPGDSAVFLMAIQTFVTEPSTGTLKIWTPYELITATLKFRASVGQLFVEQDQLSFKNCFPGKICSAVLSIKSTFMQHIHITAIKFTHPGLRFKDFNAKGTRIAPQTLTKVGRIYFDPSAVCHDRCYIRKNELSEAFPTFADLNREDGNNNLLYDSLELRRRTELFRQMKRQLQAMSLTLHSRELPPLELDFAVDIEWPRILESRHVEGAILPPTIEVGRVQLQSVVITNPTAHSLLIDYFLADPNYARETQITLPRELVEISSINCYLTDRSVFSLPNGAPKQPLLLPAGSSLSIPVEFVDVLPEKHCTLLHVRNNLTLYEAVWLTARAVQSQFRFGNRKPGSKTPFIFELTEEQFAACDVASTEDAGDAENTQPPKIGITRSFTARNMGVLPMRVDGFLIADQPCEGYGFRVLNCSSFELRANESRKIEITFATDFTNTRVARPLTLLTNLTYDVNYELLAQMPSGPSLERCASRLRRPKWERWMSNIAANMLVVSFLLVFLAALTDYRLIMVRQSASYAARAKGPVQPTFNLRNITTKINKEQTPPPEVKTPAESNNSAHKHSAKNGHAGNLKKRQTANANTAPKKSKWSPWKMDVLMPMYGEGSSGSGGNANSSAAKPETKRNERSKANPVAATVSEGSTTKSAVPLATKKEEVKPKKAASSSPQQVSRQQAKKPKQNNTQTAAAVPTAESPSEETHNITPTQKVPIAEPNACKPSPTPNLNGTHNKVVEHVEVASKVLKEHNGTMMVKKLGKTPGRERRKESTNGAGKSNNRKQRNKQLNFDANGDNAGSAATVTPSVSQPESVPLNCITSPWDTSSLVSFSDVLQTPMNSLRKSPNETNNDLRLGWGSPKNTTNATQLGPIGSKKSPTSSTSLQSAWDSCFSNTPASTTQTMLNANDFSNADTISNNLSTELYELHQAQLRQWQLHEYTLQQQLLLQQQQQPQLLLQGMDNLNWTSNTWSPLSYGAPWQTTTTTTTATNQTTTTGIRPPPGLAPSFNVNGTTNNLSLMPEESTSTNAASALTAAVAPPDTQPLTNNGMTAASAANVSSAPAYDPFSSLSAIWSDDWHHLQNSNHNNNNHMH